MEAVSNRMRLGVNFTRPADIEVECAEKVLGLFPHADMVKFAKNGSDATSAAVKLSRACTGRDMVAVCADHPFFSSDDWFIGSTPMAAGIPRQISDLTVRFGYNDLVGLEDLFNRYPGRIACIIMEAEAYAPTSHEYLQSMIDLCHRYGALFILDEIITGFRCHLGGAQALYGVVPDLSTFGKAMGNGHSVSALVGKREFMERGGLDHDKERVFLMSSTYGGETSSLAAVLATIEVYENEDVVGTLHRKGEKLAAGINEKIASNNVEGFFEVVGVPCNLIYAAHDPEMKRSQSFRSLFLQETIKRGVLMPSLVVSYSHTDADIERRRCLGGVSEGSRRRC